MKRISKIVISLLIVALTLVSCCTTGEAFAPYEHVTELVITAPAKPAASATPAAPVWVDQEYSFKIYGFDFKATLVAPNTIIFTYPEFITNDELVGFAKSAFEAYPLYLQNSTFEYGKGSSTLTLGYDVTAEEFKSFAPGVENSIASYIDAYVAHLNKVDADLKAAEEALAKAKTEAEKKAAAEAKAKAEAAAKAAADQAASAAKDAAKAEADKKAAEEKAAADKAAAEKKAAEEAQAKAEAAAKAAAEAKPAAKKSAAGIVILIIVICLAAAAAVYYFLVIKKKK